MESNVRAACGVTACATADEENSVRAPNLPSPGTAKEPSTLLGVLCGAGAALCWAAGFVAVRHGLDAGLRPADIALHRFVWIGLVLLPTLWRGGLKDIRGVSWGRALAIFVLAGPIQALVRYTGFTLAPLPHGGVIHPGSAAPLASVLAVAVAQEALRV